MINKINGHIADYWLHCYVPPQTLHYVCGTENTKIAKNGRLIVVNFHDK